VETGGVLLIIDAKNEQAVSWYESYGAMRLDDTPLKLVIPLKMLQVALQEAGKL
jgi:hypothetical protein